MSGVSPLSLVILIKTDATLLFGGYTLRNVALTSFKNIIKVNVPVDILSVTCIYVNLLIMVSLSGNLGHQVS